MKRFIIAKCSGRVMRSEGLLTFQFSALMMKYTTVWVTCSAFLHQISRTGWCTRMLKAPPGMLVQSRTGALSRQSGDLPSYLKRVMAAQCDRSSLSLFHLILLNMHDMYRHYMWTCYLLIVTRLDDWLDLLGRFYVRLVHKIP